MLYVKIKILKKIVGFLPLRQRLIFRTSFTGYLLLFGRFF